MAPSFVICARDPFSAKDRSSRDLSPTLDSPQQRKKIVVAPVLALLPVVHLVTQSHLALRPTRAAAEIVTANVAEIAIVVMTDVTAADETVVIEMTEIVKTVTAIRPRLSLSTRNTFNSSLSSRSTTSNLAILLRRCRTRCLATRHTTACLNTAILRPTRATARQSRVRSTAFDATDGLAAQAYGQYPQYPQQPGQYGAAPGQYSASPAQYGGATPAVYTGPPQQPATVQPQQTQLSQGYSNGFAGPAPAAAQSGYNPSGDQAGSQQDDQRFGERSRGSPDPQRTGAGADNEEDTKGFLGRP